MLIAQEIEYSECLTNSDNEVVHEFEPTKIIALYDDKKFDGSQLDDDDVIGQLLNRRDNLGDLPLILMSSTDYEKLKTMLYDNYNLTRKLICGIKKIP